MTTNTFEIQPMRMSDYDEVVALWRVCDGLGSLETPAEFTRFLDRNPELSTIARHGERLVGAVFCGHDGRRGYLYHLGVAADWRRQGIAESLVGRCLEKLAALGIPRCSVHLYIDNSAGQSFWGRIGWRERTDLTIFAHDL